MTKEQRRARRDLLAEKPHAREVRTGGTRWHGKGWKRRQRASQPLPSEPEPNDG